MEFDMDRTGVTIFLKTVTLNSKRVMNGLINAYNRIFQLSPDDEKDIYMQRGDHLRNKGDYPGAITAFKGALKVQLNNPDALLKLGRTYLDAGRSKDAIEALDKVTVLKPDSSRSFYYLGSAYFMIDEKNRAREAFREAVTLDSTYAEAHYKLGLVYDSMSEHDEAIEAYGMAITIKPDYVKAYQSIGLTYEGKGMRDEAVKYFKKAMQKDEKRTGVESGSGLLVNG